MQSIPFHLVAVLCSSCTYQGWLEHSKQIKKLTGAELDESGRMRESLFVARERVKNALRAQQECTEHVLRKRIFDTQRARNEFEWQIIKAKYHIPLVRATYIPFYICKTLFSFSLLFHRC